MNKYAKMMLMRSAGRGGSSDGRRGGDYGGSGVRGEYGGSGGRNEYGGSRGRSEYDGGEMSYGRAEYEGGEYGPDSRFRDRRGREHYDNGRFAPMSRGGGYGGDAMDRGGYPRSEYTEPYSHYPMSPYTPPVYERGYQNRDGYRPMNKIGFSVGGEMERLPRELGQDYRTSAGYDGMEEMPSRQGAGYSIGQRPRVMPMFNRQMAEEWVSQMQNADGTRGPHFSLEKTKEVQGQYGIDCDEMEFWIVMNMIYSDFGEALKENNASNMKLYVCLAKAWIEDKDAVPNKAAAYYTYVVQH